MDLEHIVVYMELYSTDINEYVCQQNMSHRSCYKLMRSKRYTVSLRTETQITFSLHFTPLGIMFLRCVSQRFAFLVLETIILGHYSTHC